MSIREERQSRKQPLSDSDVRALLRSVSQVVIAKGRSARRQKASETKLADLRGPSGGFRAPMLRKGRTLLVGFNEGELERMLGGQRKQSEELYQR